MTAVGRRRYRYMKSEKAYVLPDTAWIHFKKEAGLLSGGREKSSGVRAPLFHFLYFHSVENWTPIPGSPLMEMVGPSKRGPPGKGSQAQRLGPSRSAMAMTS